MAWIRRAIRNGVAERAKMIASIALTHLQQVREKAFEDNNSGRVPVLGGKLGPYCDAAEIPFIGFTNICRPVSR